MFGSHLSIAGGMFKAILAAEKIGFGTVQVFTKNQQQWSAPPLSAEVISAWHAERSRVAFEHVVSHDSYLINLASPDDVLWQKSIDLFIDEVRRCDLLGIPYLVTHPGAHVGSGDEAGLRRVAAGLDRVFVAVPDSKTLVCLESTAGQGSSLGHRLEHLAEIIAMSKFPERLAVCLDTAHLFAAGYDFRGRKYAGFMKTVASTIGADRIRVWHLNDSKKDLGSRVDRHDHIGLGKIGVEGFRPIMRDKQWLKTPKILETPKPKREDGQDWDKINLDLLSSMMK